MSSRYKLILKILLPFFMALYAIAFVNVIEANKELPVAETEWFSPETKYLRLITLGFNHLAADLMLIDTQVFVAETSDTEPGFVESKCRMFENKLDIITRLDPESYYAYSYAGYALPQYCDLMGIAFANYLVRRGWSYLPEIFQLPKLIGFNFVRYSEEPERGAMWLRIASRLPKAPVRLVWVADRLVNQSPENFAKLEIQQNVICDLCQTVSDEEQKKHLCPRCSMYNDIIELNKVANEFESKEGYRIKNLQELIDRNYIKFIPEDPAGGKYVVLENGVIDSTTNAFRKFND